MTGVNCRMLCLFLSPTLVCLTLISMLLAISALITPTAAELKDKTRFCCLAIPPAAPHSCRHSRHKQQLHTTSRGSVLWHGTQHRIVQTWRGCVSAPDSPPGTCCGPPKVCRRGVMRAFGSTAQSGHWPVSISKYPLTVPAAAAG